VCGYYWLPLKTHSSAELSKSGWSLLSGVFIGTIFRKWNFCLLVRVSTSVISDFDVWIFFLQGFSWTFWSILSELDLYPIKVKIDNFWRVMYTKNLGVRETKYSIFRFSQLFGDDDCDEECLRSLKTVKGNSSCVTILRY
jgi:hypothetical protein